MRCPSYSESFYSTLAAKTAIQESDWLPTRSAKHLAMLSNRIMCLFLSFLEVALVATPRVVIAPLAKLVGNRDFSIINDQVQSAKEAYTHSLHGSIPKEEAPVTPPQEKEDLFQSLTKKAIQFVEAHPREVMVAAGICLIAFSVFVWATSESSAKDLPEKIGKLPELASQGSIILKQKQISNDSLTLLKTAEDGIKQASQDSTAVANIAQKVSKTAGDSLALTPFTKKEIDTLKWPAPSSWEVEEGQPQFSFPMDFSPYLPYLVYATAVVGFCILIRRGVNININFNIQGQNVVMRTVGTTFDAIASTPQRIQQFFTPKRPSQGPFDSSIASRTDNKNSGKPTARNLENDFDFLSMEESSGEEYELVPEKGSFSIDSIAEQSSEVSNNAPPAPAAPPLNPPPSLEGSRVEIPLSKPRDFLEEVKKANGKPPLREASRSAIDIPVASRASSCSHESTITLKQLKAVHLKKTTPPKEGPVSAVEHPTTETKISSSGVQAMIQKFDNQPSRKTTDLSKTAFSKSKSTGRSNQKVISSVSTTHPNPEQRSISHPGTSSEAMQEKHGPISSKTEESKDNESEKRARLTPPKRKKPIEDDDSIQGGIARAVLSRRDSLAYSPLPESGPTSPSEWDEDN